MTILPSVSADVAAKLGYYVYRLVDPRDGNTFYVGKGKGNRVFAHAHGELSLSEMDDTDLNPKLATIQDILALGLEPSHVIHRHGLDETTAYEVEAALMDAYPGLTNLQGGHGSAERGAMHIKEIITMYEAATADFGDESVLIIKIRQSLDERKSRYDATRVAWKLSVDRARRADWIVAGSQGMIVGVYEAQQWHPADDPRFAHLTDPLPDRWGFEGVEAPDAIKKRWVGRRLPVEFTKPGSANPIQYTYR